ncbi:MAG TPA: carboxymuconolactone decarboxylase family protein [Ktedonobacteraceae bacterium]|nr:carboxymuconolactone decarboxylase family protein [Ktedonobacteraceae bacterium]
MSRLPAIDPAQATGKTKTLLDAVQASLGVTPNLMRTMANSPTVLEGYLQFSQALAGGVLSAQLREQIALVVAETNVCDYCVAAHTAIGASVGLDNIELVNSRAGKANDPKVDAALKFARTVVRSRGQVADENIERVRQAGYGDAEIAEIVANVVLNILTNYINLVAETEVDFPHVEVLASAAN